MIFLEHVSKSFGEQPVLKNFSYEFASHGLYRLYGRSGIGKTTLLRIIAGLETPDEGTVQGSGGVSYLVQDRRLFDSLSALENVALVAPKGQTKTDVQKRRRIFCLLSESSRRIRPNGFLNSPAVCNNVLLSHVRFSSPPPYSCLTNRPRSWMRKIALFSEE